MAKDIDIHGNLGEESQTFHDDFFFFRKKSDFRRKDVTTLEALNNHGNRRFVATFSGMPEAACSRFSSAFGRFQVGLPKTIHSITRIMKTRWQMSILQQPLLGYAHSSG